MGLLDTLFANSIFANPSPDPLGGTPLAGLLTPPVAPGAKVGGGLPGTLPNGMLMLPQSSGFPSEPDPLAGTPLEGLVKPEKPNSPQDWSAPPVPFQNGAGLAGGANTPTFGALAPAQPDSAPPAAPAPARPSDPRSIDEVPYGSLAPSLPPKAADDALPANATPTVGDARNLPAAPPSVPAPASSGGSIGQGITGLFRGLGGILSPQVAAQNETARILLDKGLAPDLTSAVAMAGNPTLMQQALGQFTTVGHDLAGNPTYGFVNGLDKSVTLPKGVSGTSTSYPLDANGQPLQGQDLLAHLKKTDPATASMVESIIRGDVSAAGKNLQKYMPIATLVDPTLQQFNYDARKKTQLDFTSGGKAGNNVKSLETVGGHLDKMADAFDKMNNGQIPIVNAAGNWVGGALGKEAAGPFETAATGVANELGSVFRSSGMSDSEVKSWRDRISSSASPEQFKANMAMLLDMLKTRKEALQDQYRNGMGRDLPPQTFQKLEGAMAKIEQRLNPTAAAAPAATAAPAPGKYVYDPKSGQLVRQ